MKKMTIEEIHGVNLEILKHIHQYCLQNGYRYNIGWGTLIGAVRHGGFIPWDDDSDIMMPRPDYESAFDHYGVSSVPELTQKIRSIPSFRGIEAPYCLDGENLYVPDLASRYFTEDVAYGTVRIQRLARQARVATPTIDMFVERIGNLVKGGK